AAQLEAAEVQHVEGDLVSLPDFAEQVLGWNCDVLKNERRRRRSVQSELVLFLAAAHAWERAFDDEGGKLVAVDFGEHDEEVGESPVGDPHLSAAQDEAAVGLPCRPRFRAERVRSRSRLAERIRADELAAQKTGQILLLLRFGAKKDER